MSPSACGVGRCAGGPWRTATRPTSCGSPWTPPGSADPAAGLGRAGGREGSGGKEERAQWHSLLYALLEGCAEGLEISRGDIDGVVHSGADGRSGLVIFDTVPGGAGSAARIASSLDVAVAAALRRVSACDCGPETSCYGCLRTPRNERHHEDLSRGAALAVLESLAGLRPDD